MPNIDTTGAQEITTSFQVSTSLLRLPSELILAIAEALETEFKVLLSLTCKYLRKLLKAHFRLSIYRDSTRVRLLYHLERDLADYTTCRECGHLFLWSRNRAANYACGCNCLHFLDRRFTLSRRRICSTHHIDLRPEVVDLIIRAHKLGPHYGLPLSYLDVNEQLHHNISCIRQACIVNDELVLGSCWTVNFHPGKTDINWITDFRQAFCGHLGQNPDPVLGRVPSSILLLSLGPGESISSKCNVCATDYKVQTEQRLYGQIRTVINTWQNFGGGEVINPSSQRIFDPQAAEEIDEHALSQRDLEAAFKQHTCKPMDSVICQHDIRPEATTSAV